MSDAMVQGMLARFITRITFFLQHGSLWPKLYAGYMTRVMHPYDWVEKAKETDWNRFVYFLSKDQRERSTVTLSSTEISVR